MLCIINRDLADGGNLLQALSVFTGGELRTTQHCARKCQQLIDAKRLGQVIISAKIQSLYLVLILPTRSNDNDWDSGKLAYFLADRKTIHPGHHYIEQYQVW